MGVSVVDICTGMNAYEAILEALIARGRTGQGADIRVSMFDSMMEWMAVPMLSTEYGAPPKRIGLSHTALAPYGVFQTADDVPILISIQNDREWAAFCAEVLEQPELGARPALCQQLRAPRQPDRDGRADAALLRRPRHRLAVAPLEEAEIAFARVNDMEAILRHPHLRRLTIDSPSGPIALPAPAGPLDGRAGPELRPAARAGRAYAGRTARVSRGIVGRRRDRGWNTRGRVIGCTSGRRLAARSLLRRRFDRVSGRQALQVGKIVGRNADQLPTPPYQRHRASRRRRF